MLEHAAASKMNHPAMEIEFSVEAADEAVLRDALGGDKAALDEGE